MDREDKTHLLGARGGRGEVVQNAIRWDLACSTRRRIDVLLIKLKGESRQGLTGEGGRVKGAGRRGRGGEAEGRAERRLTSGREIAERW